MFFNSAHSIYQLHLKNFEGPLELLNELIGSDELDITQIDLAQVTEQYLSYIKAMQEFSIEVASEFFVVAATLIYSKTRRILPKPVDENEEELLDEQELLTRLKEYRFFKALGRKLEESFDKGSVYYTRGRMLGMSDKDEPREISELTIGDLLRAVARYRGYFLRKPVPIKRRQVSVEQKVVKMMAFLEQIKSAKFSAIMADEKDKESRIAGFLGAAELALRQKAVVVQDKIFADFDIIRKD
ncbi:MAG: segregation and condensation protein A [Brevinema sp.]